MHRLQRLVTAAAVPVVVAVLATVRRSYVVDDGFIFARVASSIARGDGWAYNHGEPVNAMTSVIWTLVLAAVAFVGDIGITTLVYASASAVALLAIVLWSCRSESDPWLGLALAAAALCPTLWQSAGMETSAFLALTLATTLAHHRGHAVLAGLLLGVSILTRPDAGLMALLLAGDHLWRERRFPWKLALVSTSVVLPWLLYSHLTFGSLLPVTFGAKTLQSKLGYWAEQPSFLLSALKHHGWYWWCFAAAASGILCKRERFLTLPKPVRLFITFGFLHAVAYTLIGAPPGYLWYYAPLHMSLLILGTTGVLATSEWASERWGMPSWCAPAALILVTSVFIVAPSAHHHSYRISTEYRAAAKSIRALGCGEVAATEIGYLGYFSGCKMLDIHALIHPEALAAVRAGDATWWLAHQPEYVLVHEPKAWFGEPTYATAPERAQESFLNRYESVAEIQQPSTGTIALRVYRKRSNAVPNDNFE